MTLLLHEKNAAVYGAGGVPGDVMALVFAREAVRVDALDKRRGEGKVSA